MAVAAMAGPEIFNVNDNAKFQTDLPLFHFNASLNCQMALGSGAQIIVSKHFSASKAVETFKKYQSTHMNYIGETLRFINQVNLKHFSLTPFLSNIYLAIDHLGGKIKIFSPFLCT